VTAVDHHSLVTAFLVAYYGSETEGQAVDAPLRTVPTRDRFGLVMVRGEPHRIVDIGMRMLQPSELFRAQGFPRDYIIDRTADGKPVPKRDQTRLCGNSVCPPIARALVSANVGELLKIERLEAA
jgi:DNA (cytosine-5)-methyltransferase 1